MGGSIKVANRINNIITSQTRWTNPLPEYVQNEKFINCNFEYVQSYINRESIYLDTKGNETCSPTGYGLDFFDFDNKEIHSYQSYCDYKKIQYSSISIYLLGGVADVTTDNDMLSITPLTKEDKFFLRALVLR